METPKWALCGARHKAHARRKFDEALKAQRSSTKKKRSLKESKAYQGLAFLQKLYQIERQLQEKPPDEVHRIRQERSRPVMEKLRAWLTESIPRVPPQSLTGKALAYLDGQWPKLIRVLDDGRLPLDTNRVENAIRPFVTLRSYCTPFSSVRKQRTLGFRWCATRTPRARQRLPNAVAA